MLFAKLDKDKDPSNKTGGLAFIAGAISITIFEAQKVKEKLKNSNIKIAIANILWIKPFKIKKSWINTLKKSKFGGIILDDDYETGVASDLAYNLMKLSSKKIEIM